MEYSDLKERAKRIRDLKERAKEEGRKFFEQASKEFFINHPEVESFSWTQYTPYFNDGNTCYFGANIDPNSISINNVQGYDVEGRPEYPGYRASQSEKDLYQQNLRLHMRAYYEASDLLSILDEDDLESIFGDHVRVTVNRDGTTDISDYDHD